MMMSVNEDEDVVGEAGNGESSTGGGGAAGEVPPVVGVVSSPGGIGTAIVGIDMAGGSNGGGGGLLVAGSSGGGGGGGGASAAGGGGGNTNKRVRSDAAEWSENAINGLLDAFGARYIASHRGNLRGKDWNEVTRAVNASGVTVAKSVEQCRNKIDNLKKRFKLEREKGSPSTWPWFRTLDAIVGRAPKRASAIMDAGGAAAAAAAAAGAATGSGHRSEPDMRMSLPGIDLLDQPPPQLDQLAIPSRDAAEPQDDTDQENVAETPYSSQRDSHTDFRPFKNGKDVMSEMTNPEVNVVSNGPGKPNRKKRKNGCQVGKDVAASISSFAEVFAKIEFAKMELFKDVELRRLEMQYKLAKLAHGRKKGRPNSVSSASE